MEELSSYVSFRDEIGIGLTNTVDAGDDDDEYDDDDENDNEYHEEKKQNEAGDGNFPLSSTARQESSTSSVASSMSSTKSPPRMQRRLRRIIHRNKETKKNVVADAAAAHDDDDDDEDKNTTITTAPTEAITEALFGDVLAENVFEQHHPSRPSSTGVVAAGIATATKEGGETGFKTKSQEVDKCQDDDEPVVALIVEEGEEQQQQQEEGYSTPNVSMLNDSLLGSANEVLHEVPVSTPEKGGEKLQNKNNVGKHQQQSPKHHHHGIRIIQPAPLRMDMVPENEESITNPTTMYCMEVMPEEKVETDHLEVGDHVYQWRSWCGIPGVFQHHGIVMDIIEEPADDSSSSSTDQEQKQERKLIIADFSNVPPNHKDTTKKAGIQTRKSLQRQSTSGLTQEGILRTYTDTGRWHKVQYEASLLKRSVYRAGTCTSAKSDAVGLILARVHFIIQHPEALPDYHVVNANCECVAFWCKTGRWSTLQAASFLELTAAGQVKSTATLAGVAASTQVAVPSHGLWGWLGYTTQVSYVSIHPIVVPALAGYAVVTVGIPAIMYANARKKWNETSQQLSDAFWGSAMENPDVFAECITHWSDKR